MAVPRFGNPLIDDPGGVDFTDSRLIPILQSLGRLNPSDPRWTPGQQSYGTQPTNDWRSTFFPPSSFGAIPGGGGSGGGAVATQPAGNALQWPAGGSMAGPGTGAAAGAGASSGAAGAASTPWWKNPQTVGALLGGVTGGAGAAGAPGGGTATQSSVTTPWGPIAGDIDAILAGARDLYSTPTQFGGSGRGGGPVITPETQALLDLLGRQAQEGTPLMNAANEATIGMLGDPYGGNPLAGQVGQSIMGSLEPGGSRASDALYSLLGQTPEGYTPGLGFDARTGGAGGSSTRGQFLQAPGTASAGGGGAGGGGGTGLGTGGLFDQYIEQYLNLGENPHTQEMIDNFQREAEEDYLRSIATAEGRVESAGRMGSGFHESVLSLLGEEYNEANQSQIAQLLAGDLSERRNLGLGALGMVGNRDIANAQIQAQRDAAARSASAAAAATQMQRELGMRGLDIEEMLGLRGQDLGALGGLLGHEQNLLGLGAGLSGQIGEQQLGLLSLVPGLSEAGFGATDRALAGQFGVEQLRAQDASRRSQAATRQALEPGQRLDDYMRRILGLSDRFSPTQGESRTPAPYGGNSGLNTLLGIAGGALAGYGAFSRG